MAFWPCCPCLCKPPLKTCTKPPDDPNPTFVRIVAPGETLAVIDDKTFGAGAYTAYSTQNTYAK